MPVKKIKPFHLIVITLVSVVIALWNPLKMEKSQTLLFSTLVFTVGLWATEAVHKSLACVFLLLSFALFGKTKMTEILSFAWSDTLLLIVTTTFLSVGIMKTGVVHRYVESLFRKNSSNIFKLLILPYLFGVVLVFLIPQAFARVIIIGAILNSLLTAQTQEEQRAKQVLIFNGFMGITMTYMFFNNGDIVLNQAAIRFAGEEVKQILTFQHWLLLMAPSSLIASLVVLLLIYLIFRQDLSGFHSGMIAKDAYENSEVSKEKQRITLITMVVIILLWMTQSLHQISPWIPALAGTVVLFGIKVLNRQDLKAVNPHFLLFLLTVFSIGKVLGQSGITQIIFENLNALIPQADSSLYLLVIAAVVMVLHLCIGSSVATMSVVLPILIPLTRSFGYRSEVVTLMIYLIVNVHFLLPFHHATVMIGTAKEYYPERDMFRFGAVMTVVTFVLLYGLYFPWWKLMEVL